METPGRDPSPDRLRVLVVDDNALIALMLEACFEAAEWDVARAADGEQALQILNAHPAFDLVVLDVWLPRMNGLEVLRAMRALGVVSPVLIITAYAASLDRTHALNLGASDVLLKPFDADTLTARATRLVAPRAA